MPITNDEDRPFANDLILQLHIGGDRAALRSEYYRFFLEHFRNNRHVPKSQ